VSDRDLKSAFRAPAEGGWNNDDVLSSVRPPGVRLLRRGKLVIVGIVALLVAGAVAVAIAAREPATPSPVRLHQVATWGASPLPDYTGRRFTDQTFRNVVYTSVGGKNLRIRLSNDYGHAPVAFTDVRVGRQQRGAAIVPGTNRAVTFDGHRSVTLYPGTDVYSDPLPGDVPAAQHLVVSIYLPGPSGPTTNHWSSEQTTYVSTRGDHAADEHAAAYPSAGDDTVWWYLDAITVEVPGSVHTVVALGDSLTDGYASSLNAERRYPDLLAARLRQQPKRGQFGVLNEGVSGEKVTTGMLSRLDRDVFAQPGVTSIIYLGGINDISTDHTAAQLIAADTQIIDRAHVLGIRVLGGTLTPFAGSITYNAARERTRQSLNRWIRTSGAFDGVVDFDRALRDPADPMNLRAAYDSGDHIHPDDAGYAAMADAVDLHALLPGDAARTAG
jgi:lysophospholipase L1-like esterase